jgi:ketosteroid isomerase-like protein
MHRALPILAAAAALWAAPVWADDTSDPARQVLALEKQAMDGWLTGNPDPQLAIFDSEITYFHIMSDKRIEGLPAVRQLFEQYRGKRLYDSYEMLNPKVQVSGDVAILTYQLARVNGSVTTSWKGTLVYQKKKEGWRVIHCHWSTVNPQP